MFKPTTLLTTSALAVFLSATLITANAQESTGTGATSSQQQWQQQPEQRAQRRLKHFQAMDQNGDGNLSLDEMRTAMLARLDKRFQAMDENGDGAIAASEFKPGKGGRMRKSGQGNPN